MFKKDFLRWNIMNYGLNNFCTNLLWSYKEYSSCKPNGVQVFKIKFTLLAFELNLWKISLYAPKIVSHHIYIPSTLILLFHKPQILVESLNFLIADFTKIYRQVCTMAMQKMQLYAYVSTERFETL